MMYAAYIGATEAIKNLIQRGAEMRSKDGYGNIALHWASVGGHESSCNMLLDAGANINSQTNTGYTALMFAAEQGHMEVVQILLGNWADSKIKNKRGFTALALCKKSLQELNYLNSEKLSCADVIKAYEAKLEETKGKLPII
jgi:ankyrin repeat protein